MKTAIRACVQCGAKRHRDRMEWLIVDKAKYGGNVCKACAKKEHTRKRQADRVRYADLRKRRICFWCDGVVDNRTDRKGQLSGKRWRHDDCDVRCKADIAASNKRITRAVNDIFSGRL